MIIFDSYLSSSMVSAGLVGPNINMINSKICNRALNKSEF